MIVFINIYIYSLYDAPISMVFLDYDIVEYPKQRPGFSFFSLAHLGFR